MYHELPPKVCSKCGSIRSEEFTQRRKSGVRCLNCGHESITKEHDSRIGEQICWTRVSTANEF